MKLRTLSVKVSLLVAFFVLIGTAFSGNAAESEDASFIEPINELGIGTFSGKVQTLFMRRNYDGQDASSGTLAETLNYRSPQLGPFTFGLQYIHADRLFEGGSLDPANGAGWTILNTDFDVLNEAYINLNFDFAGLSGTDLTVGRQIADYNFAPTYAIRQKPQAIEGVTISSEDVPGVTFEIGHIEEFSSWSTRDGGSDLYKASFNDIEDVIADSEGVATPDTDGMQFVSVSSDMLPRTNVTVYDLFGEDLYNTFGAKADVSLLKSEELDVTWKNHYIMQKDVGNFPNEIDAQTIESAVAFESGPFMLQPGFMTVFGGDGDNDLRHPLESSMTWEYVLDWYTRPYLEGSDSAYLKGTYKYGDTLFYALYFATDHDRRTSGGAFDQELDIVIKHNITDRFYVTLKAGYGYQNNRGGNDDTDREDYRLFVGYKF